MSNQIVISSGAKVRSLEGVLTGSAGIVGSVPLGGANGVATLDSSGKVPLSQLPASVVTYLGTWNAATNTPTLTNGVGDVGDLYICNVAGTVNFGAGPITFAVGDWVIYNGSQWQKSTGASGTVTSVAVSSTGNDAISITGSPITTAGTINIGFTGTSAQYVNGAGDLTTFPSLTGFVPYTGATTDVDLGVHVLNAQALHVKGTAGAGHLGLKHQSAAATGSANESLIFANVDGDLAWQNDNLYLTTLSTHANTANRVYTFPDLNGTMAMLEGNQTFSGAKSFSGSVSFISSLGNSPIVNFGLALVKGNSPSSTSGAWSQIYAAAGNNNLIIADSSNTSLLQFQGTSSYTYTYPASSGTLALTSNLTSYVPYTGATGNVDLGSKDLVTRRIYLNTNNEGIYAKDLAGTTLYQILVLNNLNKVSIDQNGLGAVFGGVASFAGSVNNDDGLKIKLGSASNLTAGYLTLSAYGETTPLPDRTILRIGTSATQMSLFKLQNTGSYTYDLPASSGTIALTSDLSNYVTLTGASQTISSAKAFTTFPTTFKDVVIDGSGTSASGVNLKIATGGIVSAGSGYTLIYSSAAKKITIYDNASNTNGVLDFSAITTNVLRTYSYPDANGTLVLGTGTTNYHAKFTASGVLGNSLIFDDGTNVGIGTTTLSYRLSFGGDTATTIGMIQSALGTAPALTLRGADSTTGTNNEGGAVYISSGLGTGNGATSNIIFSTAPSVGSGTTRQSLVERMRITSSGNVSIGTTNTTARFNIQASANFETPTLGTATGTMGYLSANGLYGMYVGIGNSGNTWLQSQRNDGTTTAYNLLLNPQGGNVGIGTSSPNAKLSLGTGGGTKFLLYDGGFTGSGGNGYFAGFAIDSPNANDTTLLAHYQGALVFGRYTNANDTSAITERMRITSGGALYCGGVYSATGSNAANVVVASDGQIYRSTSSLKYKDNIQDYSKGLSEVLQLRPVTYNSKNPNESGITYAGLIAEEVHDLGLIEFVQYAEDGTPDALAYQNMVALLTKSIQELSAKVTALENK